MHTAATEGLTVLRVPSHVGNYQLTEVIGRGRYSVVFSGQNTLNGQEVAIKVMSYSSISKANQVRQLKRELQVLLELDHLNVCKCYEVFEDGDLIFIVLEKCDGGNLFSWLTHRKIVAKADYLRLFHDIAEGINHVHSRGWSHSDIKLENVMIDSDGRAKLIHFGCAKHTQFAGDDDKSGTALYSAPELFVRGIFRPQKADIWSLGIVLYALATGAFPFPCADGRKVAQFARKGRLAYPKVIDTQVRELVRRMTAVNPNERPTIDTILRDPIFSSIAKTEKTQQSEADIEASFFLL
jgi:serine/threonine protein kinase